MRRREFIGSLIGTAVAWPLASHAQQSAMPVIGFLHALSGTSYLDSLRQGLADRGFVEGRDVTIEYRWAEGHNERLPVLAKELVSLAPNAIVVQGSPAVAALRRKISPYRSCSEIRTRHQSQDRQGAWHHHPTIHHGPSRRGDRVKRQRAWQVTRKHVGTLR
jgi:hypothetical protein